MVHVSAPVAVSLTSINGIFVHSCQITDMQLLRVLRRHHQIPDEQQQHVCACITKFLTQPLQLSLVPRLTGTVAVCVTAICAGLGEGNH